MSTDIGTGDSETPWIVVAPADNTTQAALTVTAPDGTSTLIAATSGAFVPIDSSDDQEQQWTATQPVVYDQAGRWVLAWTITGTGQGVEDLEVFVVASPVAGGPTWTPGRSRVAAYVPHRTLARNTGSTIASEDAYQFTFDSTTVPTGIVCDRLISDGVDWVSALLEPVNTKTEKAAALLAALHAAIAIERSWPDDDQSLQRANDMEKRLDSLLTALTKSNAAANEGDGVTYPVAPVNPYWSFPPADERFDYPTYF